MKLLSRYGNVATEHIGKEGLDGMGEVELSDEEIYERDMSWLAEADVVVAEITTPSLGVGYEIARAETMEKSVLCLYRLGGGGRLSAMLAGNPNLQKEAYETVEDLAEILDNFLRMD
jgi:CRISPR/Cas system CSM-associated protein Csm3 (group 7 of RAMP superfamily)